MAYVGRDADNDEKCIYENANNNPIDKSDYENENWQCPQARRKDMWARIDVNGNGYVSLAEITKVLYQLHKYHHKQIEKS